MSAKIGGYCATEGSFLRVAKPFESLGRTWNVGTYVYVQHHLVVDSSNDYFVALIREDDEHLVPPQWCHDQASAKRFDAAILDGTLVPVSTDVYRRLKNTMEPSRRAFNIPRFSVFPNERVRRICAVGDLIYQQKGT